MTRSLTTALGISAATAMFFAVPAMAQQAQQPQIPDGWFKSCNKQQDVDVCNVQRIITADTGQLVTGVSLIELKGKVNRKVFQVTVPTARLMPPGVGLQIDTGKTQKVDYMICFPDRCIAEVLLNDALVGQLKKGTNLVLTSVNFQNKPNPVRISLQGFTGAYDGAPMKESDIADRQKALQQNILKNNEEYAKKLKEAQEKAKTAN